MGTAGRRWDWQTATEPPGAGAWWWPGAPARLVVALWCSGSTPHSQGRAEMRSARGARKPTASSPPFPLQTGGWGEERGFLQPEAQNRAEQQSGVPRPWTRATNKCLPAGHGDGRTPLGLADGH
ncbi:hypothetical protein NDU88_001330 [Pleurodeles waltl]|uniref:Uncharacterized protein n=1 Tax=Pleurodeles waltl TaxID=8319 RepID=A0AAV7USH3_PLEWA|nr:hypothetical protein NDU88_001330 [Pleurodeles waltl]